MRLTFVHFADFVRDLKRYRLVDEDLQAIESILMQNPEAGKVLAGTGGMRKIRFASPGRHVGKSGAYRVGYIYFQVGDRIVLLSIFAKKDKENLSTAEKAYYKKVIELFKPKLEQP